MISFEPLASSSAGCAYVVRCGNAAPLLIDAGLTFRQIQVAMGFKTSELAGALISHAHGDHCKAVPEILLAGINGYASAEAWKEMIGRGFQVHRRQKILTTEVETNVGPWSVLPFSAVHDSPGTLAFVVTSPDRDRLLYLTDTAYSPFRFEGLTHVAVEANWSREIIRGRTLHVEQSKERFRRTLQNHMSIERLIEMLKANDLSNVREIHLLHLSDGNSDEVEFKRMVERETGRPVYIAAKGGR